MTRDWYKRETPESQREPSGCLEGNETDGTSRQRQWQAEVLAKDVNE